MKQYRIIFKVAERSFNVLRANTKEGAFDLIFKTLTENKGASVVSISIQDVTPQAIAVDE